MNNGLYINSNMSLDLLTRNLIERNGDFKSLSQVRLKKLENSKKTDHLSGPVWVERTLSQDKLKQTAF